MVTPTKLWSSAFAALTGLLLGCAVYIDPGEEGSCEDICGDNASCKKGVCICDPGYDGFPEMEKGCMPTQPPPGMNACELGCGPNAYCQDDLCYCQAGAVSVCGNGGCTPLDAVCDGTLDCFDGNDEAVEICNPTVIMNWSVIDSCADGIDIEWRLFSDDRDWVWPGGDGVFWTGGLDIEIIESIECATGETICFGGAAGEQSWGVGIEGLDYCDDCCWQCEEYATALVPYLVCS
ncbi:MAG: low-density lipoprotein receptor class A repeat-containing protein [Nannocystaceae bacterium]